MDSKKKVHHVRNPKVPSKTGQLRHPADINKPLREAAKEKANKYQHTYANNHSISFLPAIFSTSGRTDAEFLRLLFYHAHRESEEFFRLTGQLAQPNQDYVFSKRAAFFNGLKSKVGHIMAKATALRVNLNLAPSIPSTPSKTGQLPSKTDQLRHPADINKSLREADKEKVKKYQHTYANNHSISFLPAIFSTSGNIDAEFLRLLFS